MSRPRDRGKFSFKKSPNGMFVMDYTARQFHPGLPWPFAAGVEDWKAALEKASGTVWVFED